METERFVTVSTKNPPLVHIVSQINLLHTTPSHLRTILILSSYLSFWLSRQNPIRITLRHACYMIFKSNPTSRGYSNYICRMVKITNLLITQFSPTSRHFTSFPAKYYPVPTTFQSALFSEAALFSLCPPLRRKNMLLSTYMRAIQCRQLVIKGSRVRSQRSPTHLTQKQQIICQ
jgi:hypothetical protein